MTVLTRSGPDRHRREGVVVTRSGLNRHGPAGVLLAVTLALFMASPSMAQTEGGEWLVGRVEESGSGEPLAGVDVRIEGCTTVEGRTTIEGRTTMTAVTEADGGWRIGPLPAGEYSLSIAHIGFASVQRSVRIPQQDGPLRIALTARPLALGALIVTAGRRAQRLSEAAVATELITSREIRETGASDLASVLTERTGLELEGGHPVGQGVMIQGMGSERVLILLDGQPFIGRISGSIDVSRIPTSMIERVEVVKGPQSTLYGSEAMGGVVNVITRNPEASAWTTSATAVAGNRGRTDIAGSVMGGAGAFTGLVDAGRRSVDLAPGWAGSGGAVSGAGTRCRRLVGGRRSTGCVWRRARCSSMRLSAGAAVSSTSSRTTASGAGEWAACSSAAGTG